MTRKRAVLGMALAGVLSAGAAGAAGVPSPAQTEVQSQVEASEAGHAAAQMEAPGAPSQPASQVEASGTERSVPFSFELVPGLGFPDSGNAVKHVSLGLLTTHAGRLDGLAASLVGNRVDRGARGVEATLVFNTAGGNLDGAQLAVGFNVVGGHVLGLQSAVGFNVGGSVQGVQAAVGFNVAQGAVKGAQLAVGFNVAGGEVRGWQAAVGANVAPGEVRGLQTAVGFNLTRHRLVGLQAAVGVNAALEELHGLQTTAGVGYARKVSGAQLSLVNVGGDVDGAQIGLINIGGRVKGLQLGLVNVAGETDATVGLLSFSPRIHVQAYASDVALTNVALKMGGKYVHSLLTLGYQPGDTSRRYFATGLGFGMHLPLGNHFYTDVDLLGSTVHTTFLGDRSNVLGQLRVVGGLQLASHFSVFAGVTANTFVDWRGEGANQLGEGFGWHEDAGRVHLRMWPGLVAGLQL